MTDIPAVALPEGVLLMDGGMGQELKLRGSNNAAPLWSAQALFEDPDMVLAVHRDYVAAGAKLLITNTYATTRLRFEGAGIADRFAEINHLASEIAMRARDEAGAAGADVLIAGSLPPMHGSYRAEDVRPFEEIEPLFREQAEVLAPHVDLFLCETMSTGEEGRAAAVGAASTGKPVWVSWTLVDDGRPILRSGETVAEAYARLEGLPVSAFLANCSAPESLTAAMPELVGLSDWPAGGYANGFHPIPADWRSGDGADKIGQREDLGPEAYATFVMDWVDAGARVGGGCCHVGPDHIRRLHEMLN